MEQTHPEGGDPRQEEEGGVPIGESSRPLSGFELLVRDAGVGVVLGVAPEVKKEPVRHPVEGVPGMDFRDFLVDSGADLPTRQTIVFDIVHGLQDQDSNSPLGEV